MANGCAEDGVGDVVQHAADPTTDALPAKLCTSGDDQLRSGEAEWVTGLVGDHTGADRDHHEPEQRGLVNPGGGSSGPWITNADV